MSTHDGFVHLVNWCREAPLDTMTAPVEEDYWGFCAANSQLETTWFAWFPTLDALLRYLSDCWPFDYHAAPETFEGDPAVVLKAARFGVAVRRYAASEIEEDLLLAILSEAHPDVTVQWLGTFGDMLDGDGSFAREWRADFRGLDILDGGCPIEQDELDDMLRAMAWD